MERNVIPQESCFNPALCSAGTRCFQHDMRGCPQTTEEYFPAQKSLDFLKRTY
jgi:hypothetical protein